MIERLIKLRMKTNRERMKETFVVKHAVNSCNSCDLCLAQSPHYNDWQF